MPAALPPPAPSRRRTAAATSSNRWSVVGFSVGIPGHPALSGRSARNYDSRRRRRFSASPSVEPLCRLIGQERRVLGRWRGCEETAARPNGPSAAGPAGLQ
ncbi:MAG: hypothetical protein MZV63_23785 [Marinilabiliales bacterium]|nr:hypothetical protein [Marinilabiliales bacterium]